MIAYTKIAFVAASLMTWLAMAEYALAVDVMVDTTTLHAIAGESKIPKGIFGGTAFCNTGEFATPDIAGGSVLANDLRLGMVRLVANTAWWLPQERPEQMPADLTALFNMNTYNRGGPPWNSMPYPISHVLRNFETGMEADALLIIGDNTGPEWFARDRIPVDMNEYADVLTTLVRLARKDHPKLKYVHLVNEANSYWYNHYPDPGAAYVDYFLLLARKLHREFPGLQVGGPIHCWPPHYPPVQQGFPNWYTWENWSQPLIEAAGRELGFFDYHYGTTPEDTTFALRVVTAEAMRAHRYRLKSVISEASPDWQLSGEPLENLSKLLEARTLAWERYLFSLLRERDKVLGSLWHDLGCGGGIGLRATAHWGEYWVLWIFRNLRGDALHSVSRDATHPTVASVENGRVTVVTWNDSPEPRPVTLKLVLPAGARPTITAERLEWDLAADQGKGQVIHGTMPPDLLQFETGDGAAYLSWQAAPWANYAIYALFPDGLEPTRIIRQDEFFGDAVMGTLSPDHPVAEVTVDVDGEVLASAQEVVLRIGLLDVARDCQVTVGAGKWQSPLPRPRSGAAVIQQVIVDGELKAETAAPPTHTGNYELAAPFIIPGRNTLRLSAEFREGDPPVRIGYVTAATVSRPGDRP